MKKIVIATKNAGKVREMRDALQGFPVEIVALDSFGSLPDAVEDGTTFEENSLIKARFYQQQTGCACLADDSGLEIEAFHGEPGVYSARWSGAHDDKKNNAKLVAELKQLPSHQSRAAYRCVLTFVDTDGTTLTTEGSCTGKVRPEAQGDNGFGYDPYFYVDESRTMADLSLAEKQAISHRGEALRKMADRLRRYLGEPA
jgi:XTP/dITP diphosphohydrolase